MTNNFFNQLKDFFGNSAENEQIVMSDDLLIDDVFSADSESITIAAIDNMTTRAQVCRDGAR